SNPAGKNQSRALVRIKVPGSQRRPHERRAGDDSTIHSLAARWKQPADSSTRGASHAAAIGRRNSRTSASSTRVKGARRTRPPPSDLGMWTRTYKSRRAGRAHRGSFDQRTACETRTLRPKRSQYAARPLSRTRGFAIGGPDLTTEKDGRRINPL